MDISNRSFAVIIHYDPREAELLADRIRREGFEAEACPVAGAKASAWVRRRQPDIVVIDLMRMPSYGRALGCLLREQKSTRAIPLLFVEGDPEKTRRVRRVLPDAGFTKLPRIGAGIEKAIRDAPADPVAPDSTRIPAVTKLRIREGSTVALLHAPEGFEAVLAPLPKNVKFQTAVHDAATILLFVRSSFDLARELPRIAAELEPKSALWILWPKKSSGQRSDLTAQRIWNACPTFGLAAHRVCAIDKTWSALAIASAQPK
jgi:CheY-like chemotaxis protein